MFQVCKHDIMLPFVQEKSEDRQYREMANDFRDSLTRLCLFKQMAHHKRFQWEYIYNQFIYLKMCPFIPNNRIKVFICKYLKLKVNYIYIFQMYKYIRISLNWQWGQMWECEPPHLHLASVLVWSFLKKQNVQIEEQHQLQK